MFTPDILSSSSVLQWVLAWSTCHSDIMTEIREWKEVGRQSARHRKKVTRKSKRSCLISMMAGRHTPKQTQSGDAWSRMKALLLLKIVQSSALEVSLSVRGVADSGWEGMRAESSVSAHHSSIIRFDAVAHLQPLFL